MLPIIPPLQSHIDRLTSNFAQSRQNDYCGLYEAQYHTPGQLHGRQDSAYRVCKGELKNKPDYTCE